MNDSNFHILASYGSSEIGIRTTILAFISSNSSVHTVHYKGRILLYRYPVY